MIYLYVKTHNVTGLKYLGKTMSADPHSYPGSGTRWKRHIKKHGNDVTTEILLASRSANGLGICSYTNQGRQEPKTYLALLPLSEHILAGARERTSLASYVVLKLGLETT